MATPERMVIENCFRLVDKEQEDVDFHLNSAQAYIDDHFYRRLLIPKARQEGVSTYFLARSTVKCLGVKNTRAVIISHEAASTERMLNKVRYFLEHFKGPKPIIKTNSKNELSFPKTNSVFYIGTAGNRDFGRSDTITDLHCSEVAYWPDPKRLMGGLLQAVPKRTGSISIESTGNGAGNWYHSQCMKAAKGMSSYRMIFLPWYKFPEYNIELTDDEAKDVLHNLREDLDEPRLLSSYSLTPNQILWRRQVIEDECDGDLYIWNKEYPSCLDDCFQAAGGGIFKSVNFVETPDWQHIEANYWKLKGHPRSDLHYVVGADVSAGVGKDSSVAEVYCLETDEQVAEYVNSKIEPDAFGYKLAAIGREFNEAYISCESNNHGLLTLKTLGTWNYDTSSVTYPTNKVYRTPAPRRHGFKDDVKRLVDLGVRTSSRSKPYIIGTLRTALKDTATIHSQILRNELSTFVELEDGSMGAADGCHDDTVMASGMAFFVKSKAALTLLDSPVQASELKSVDNPFSLEGMIKEMTGDRERKASTFPSYITGDFEL